MPQGDRGLDELYERAGPAVVGEREIRLRIVAYHRDFRGQTRVVQRERPAGSHQILDEIVSRRRLEKVRRVDRVAGPEAADRGMKLLGTFEDEMVRAIKLVDSLPRRNARIELKIGVPV
jgi:hypothetical protein